MDQLMQKLMISKAIMDKTDGITRGDSRSMNTPSNMLENFEVPQAKYNIPQEFLQLMQLKILNYLMKSKG